MKIIDFRCRAPFSTYPSSMFEPNYIRAFIEHFKIGSATRAASARFLYDPRMEVLFEEMEEAEVVKAVVPCRTCKNVSNEEGMDLMAKYPDKLHVMPGVDGLFVPEALETIEKYCVNGPSKGITIEPGWSEPALYSDDERLFPIYEKCAENDLVVFISFGGICCNSISYNEPSIISRVAMAFPKAKFVLAHGGYPYTNEICFTAFQHSNIYILPDFYFLGVPGGSNYTYAMNYIPNQMIFGSAAPIANIKEMKDYYMNCGADMEDLEKVMYKNAAKLLGME